MFINMIPVIAGIAATLEIDPTVLYFEFPDSHFVFFGNYILLVLFMKIAIFGHIP